MGTPAYMAPEQAKGQPGPTSDPTSWAFGCVLYEMLAGRRAFDGADTTELLAAVVRDNPDWDALPRETPAAIRRLLLRCLAKDEPGDWQTSATPGSTLTKRRPNLSSAANSRPPRRPRSDPDRRSRAGSRWLGAGVALLAAALLVIQALTPSSPLPVPQLQRMTNAVGNEELPALSPDGKFVAYVAAKDGRRQIFVRLLTGGDHFQLTNDDLDHQWPRWTPDSAAVVYFTPGRTEGEAGTIWEIPALGGQPRPLMEAASGADVSRDGRGIAAFQYADKGMVLVTGARDGSAREQRVQLPEEFLYTYPRWSPDDRWIAFCSPTPSDSTSACSRSPAPAENHAKWLRPTA